MKQLKSEIHQAGIISTAFSAIIMVGLVYRSQFTEHYRSVYLQIGNSMRTQLIATTPSPSLPMQRVG
jgi:hypothetical protein